MWGGDAAWSIDSGEHPHEAGYLKLDCSKAHELLNWYPKWGLLDALEKIVEWHKKELNGEDLRLTTLNQIETYMNIISD